MVLNTKYFMFFKFEIRYSQFEMLFVPHFPPFLKYAAIYACPGASLLPREIHDSDRVAYFTAIAPVDDRGVTLW